MSADHCKRDILLYGIRSVLLEKSQLYTTILASICKGAHIYELMPNCLNVLLDFSPPECFSWHKDVFVASLCFSSHKDVFFVSLRYQSKIALRNSSSAASLY